MRASAAAYRADTSNPIVVGNRRWRHLWASCGLPHFHRYQEHLRLAGECEAFGEQVVRHQVPLAVHQIRDHPKPLFATTMCQTQAART